MISCVKEIFAPLESPAACSVDNGSSFFSEHGI
jgi:hypothetical protein